MAPVVDHGRQPAANRPLAGAVARGPVPTVDAACDVRTAARRMAKAGTDVVLVLDAGRVTGILTATNLVRLLASGEH